MTKITILEAPSTKRSDLIPSLEGEYPGKISGLYDQPEVFQINGKKVQFMSLENRTAELYPHFWKFSDAFIYHVNLNTELSIKVAEQQAKNIEDFKAENPKAVLILVGSYDEPVDEEALQGIEEQFRKLNCSFDYRVAVPVFQKNKVKGEEYVATLRQAVLKPLYEAVKPSEKAEPVIPKSIPQHDFPKSYTTLWQAGTDNFDSAMEILRDYCKLSQTPGCCSFFQSKIKLAATFNLLRNHTDTVSKIYMEYKKDESTDIQSLLKKLTDALVKSGRDINPNGSLAKRIHFIEKQAHLEPTDFGALQQKINDNRKPSFSA